ncbi:2'-5' RNA ligase family protein [Terribacillus saccharophilus]|uniref:2'-5' RNA ligase family protein n=1 Tax=Terribacillus saccharophilus TaxID=361277 RepID=UPI0039825865
MYAIVGYVDQVTESKILGLWKEMRDKDITDYPYQREGHRPHLTFSSFTEPEPDLLHEIERLSTQAKAVPLRFRLFGSFMKSDSFLLLPDSNNELTELHRKVLALQSAPSLYTPGIWIPHITIANHLNPDQQSAVQQLAQQRLEPFSGSLIKLAFIQITEHAVIELKVNFL